MTASPLELKYYAKDREVFQRPVTTDNGDGTKSISIGFPICTMTDYCASQADIVAGLMNRGDATAVLVEALEAARAVILGMPSAHVDEYLAPIDAALALAGTRERSRRD
jgi:hypothetical protein